MDQRGGTTSHFIEDAHFAAERHFGFRKPHTISDHLDGTSSIVGGKLASSPLKKLPPNGALSVHCAEMSQSILARDQKAKLPVSEGSAKISSTSWNVMDYHPKSWSSLSTQPPPYNLNRSSGCGTQWESSLFSSSLSEIFGKKLQLLGNDIQSNQPARNVAYYHAEEELFESLEKIEAQTIGSLLPTEDDLFSGITNELEHNNPHGNSADDSEEFDLFSSGGGMELEGDALLVMGKANSDFFRGGCDSQGSSNSLVNEHPYDENPSRTLFVRNINSNVEDSELKAFFEQYGDIRTLYTSKSRGFVMVSYYDIRAAQNAIKTIQNLPLWHRKLDIHYSTLKASEKDINQGTLVVFNLDPSVTVAELHQIFGVYGEIKDILKTPQKSDHKFIEYYDVRAAEAALAALNRSEVAGKQVKLEPSCSGRHLTQQPEQDLEEPNLCQSPLDDLSSGRVAAFCPGMTVSSNMDNGSTLASHSAAYSPVGAFIEPRQSSSFPSILPSPVMTASVGKKIGLNESNRTLNETKFGNHCLPSFHPHSLPEYHDSLADGIPYNSDSMGSMASANGFNVTDATNIKHIGGVRSNGHPLDLNGGVFGSSGNGSCNLPGHQYIWNNSNPRHQHHSGRMIWQNSQPFVNGVHVHPLSHLPGFPRAAPVMLNTARSHFHVGSAPAVNPPIWERQHAFSAESPEASSFHLDSLGGMGFPGNSQPHPMKVASCNLLSHVGGSFMGVRSPQQMCHIFPGRNLMISMPSSFDSPNEHVRNISHHRIESNANHSDKKQYELDIERILLGEDSRTTLMIKNIPNKYTSKMLLAAIDEHCRGTYDFIYLPIDFKNKCNVGYAFINMIDPQQIIPFHKAFSGKKWEKFNSEKVASLAYARIQGKAALIAHFQNSSLMNEDKRCRPIIFHTDGPNAGDPEPFPICTNLKSRLGKPRTCGNKENHQNGNSSVFISGEDSSCGTDSSPGSD